MSKQTSPALAANGGPKAAADLQIPDWPQINDESYEYVRDCVESGAWCRLDSEATYVDQLEERYAALHDAEYAIAVSNGTVAIELALRMCGVEPGDEVIVPGYTFIATASAVACMGAVPTIVDVDPATCNIDPESVRDAVTDDTVGIVAVNFGGRPIDFDAILEITEEEDLFLIEDSAQTHGSEWRGEKVGTIGDVGTFSFQASKAISGGEGGMVLTDDPILAEKGELLHNIGREPGKPGYRHYVLSSNYRMSEIQASLLCAQLEKFPAEFERRQEAAATLRAAFDEIPGIEPQPVDDRITEPGYANITVRYDSEAFGGLPKDVFIEALGAEGVPVSGGYGLPLNEQPAFEREHVQSLLPDDVDLPLYRNLSLPGTEETIATRVSFSQRYLLADPEHLHLIPAAIEKIQEHADHLEW